MTAYKPVSNKPTAGGQGLIIKYLQQILFTAIIGFGAYMFNWIGKLGEENANKDKLIIQLQDQIKDFQKDLQDVSNDQDAVKAEIEDLKDNHNSRLIRLEDFNVIYIYGRRNTQK